MTESLPSFYHVLPVRYADTDAQGHVFFGNYFTYMDEALGGYLRALGLAVADLQALGIDFVYVDAHCQYKGSARYEDVLHVHAHMARIGNTSFTVACTITLADSDRAIAAGAITAVTVDAVTRQPARLPDAIRAAVARFASKESIEQL